MYVTAQLVQTSDRTRQAINTVVYSHRAGELPVLPDGTPDVAKAAQDAPGTLLAAVSGLPPGGNSVLAWLDMAAPDGLNPDKLAIALQSGAAAYPGSSMPCIWAVRPVALRFNVLPALQASAPHLLRDLTSELLLLFKSGVMHGDVRNIMPAPSPLRVMVTRDHIGARYELAPETAAPLRSLPAARPAQPAVLVPASQRDRMEALFGNVYAQISQLLTGLSLDQVNALAGIQFIDDDGGLLWDSRV